MPDLNRPDRTPQPEMNPETRRAVEEFTSWGCPVFPVLVRHFRGKWEKIPLTEKGHLDARTDWQALDWSRANACGIVMGNGFYTIDVDSYKEGANDNVNAWAKSHGVPMATRSHRTPSGGFHLIFRLPPGWENLRTRAGVVPGMDTRGAGGWIAFGKGYEVVRSMPPSTLPPKACEALDGSSDGASGPVILKGYTPPADAAALQARLRRVLVFGPALLRARWAGKTHGLVDKSRSAMDHSVAKLLALAGWNEDEIVWALLNEFQHGAARDKGNERVALRAAGRSAVKADQSVEQERAAVHDFQPPETSPEIEDAMREMMKR